MESTAKNTLPTRNEAFGFYGTMACTGHDAGKAWAIAAPLIVAATSCSPEGARGFLDSTHGRHFADEVTNQMARHLSLETAIRAAIDTHQNWRIDRRTSRQHGIPAGLPYLTGWAAQFDVLEEMEG
jgi:hypothetical protein